MLGFTHPYGNLLSRILKTEVSLEREKVKEIKGLKETRESLNQHPM
jgi:hypothetical protein